MIKTRLTEMLGCEHPIMLAGMGGIAGKHLVGAVARAGGFGTWGSSNAVQNEDIDELRETLGEIRRLCDGRPFGVDILVHGKDGGVMDALIDVFAEGGARAFISGRGFPSKEVIAKFHQRGMVVGSICGRGKHAREAVAAGVDFLICQGAEGGGHTGNVGLGVLLPIVLDSVGGRVPVVAAGGIFDGRGLASVLTMGASGAWVGTRFLLSHEANARKLYKNRLIEASEEDTTVSRAFTGKPLRVIANAYTDKYEKYPSLQVEGPRQITQAIKDGCWAHYYNMGSLADSEIKNVDILAFSAGQCIGAIKEIRSAGDIVRVMMKDAVQCLRCSKNYELSKL